MREDGGAVEDGEEEGLRLCGEGGDAGAERR